MIKYQYQDFAPKPYRNSEPAEPVKRKKPVKILLILIITFSCYKILTSSIPYETSEVLSPVKPLLAVDLPPNADYFSNFENFPNPDTFSYENKAFGIQYSIDSALNNRVEVYLKRHRPEVGVFVVCDLESGQIISLGERKDSTVFRRPELLFGKDFPAASLFKIVTALSALNQGKHSDDSLIQIGSYYTLYNRQLKINPSANYPKITLKKAFSKSVNPAFGLLGQEVGPEALRTAAMTLGFNRYSLPGVLNRSAAIIPDSGYKLAEVSCGFTKSLTISPLHALEIARMIGSDGNLIHCSFADSISIVTDSESTELKISRNEEEGRLIDEIKVRGMQELMEATVSQGTARKHIRKILNSHHLDKLIIGGKTGSLDGSDPKGRYGWFIGYAKLKDDPKQGIAVTVMQVHQSYRSLHEASMAGLIIRDWLTAKNKQKKSS